jgi:hypothetical protein
VTIDIARLPRKTLKAGTQLYRIHRADKGAWFFSDSANGRFNPTGSPGRGACYWAERPLGAWVEAFRTTLTLTRDDIAARALSTIRLTSDLVVRDLTVKRALAAGVTAAVSAGGDYTPPQQLADALQRLHDGVRYRARHDLSQQLIAIAWFGNAGPVPDPANVNLPRAIPEDIPDELVDEACRLFGYRVLPSPG